MYKKHIKDTFKNADVKKKTSFQKDKNYGILWIKLRKIIKLIMNSVEILNMSAKHVEHMQTRFVLKLLSFVDDLEFYSGLCIVLDVC